jgi:hypothetical protein
MFQLGGLHYCGFDNVVLVLEGGGWGGGCCMRSV